ncbi:LysR family transcriptional regulator [Parasalinivibrio latis]
MRKASQKLYVSQPAISQSLKKLRHHFNDELFIKTRTGLKATPFADNLLSRVKPHLDGLHGALNDSTEFDPTTVVRSLRIALAPQVLSTLAGDLVTTIKQQAPGINLQLINWNRHTVDDIVHGEIDFGINYDLPDVPKEVMSQALMDIQATVVVRKDHPVNANVVTPHDLEGYEIASLMIPGWNKAQSLAASVMEHHELDYEIGFSSELPSAILGVVQKTDMYFPTLHIFPIDDYPKLRMMDVEVDCVPTSYPIVSYYHQKDRNSDFTQWLKRVLITTLQSHNK